MLDKKNLECEVVSKQEYDDMVAAFKNEIRRLQKLNAKQQVAHESEIEKVRAECEARLLPDIELNFIKPKNSHTEISE